MGVIVGTLGVGVIVGESGVGSPTGRGEGVGRTTEGCAVVAVLGDTWGNVTGIAVVSVDGPTRGWVKGDG